VVSGQLAQFGVVPLDAFELRLRPLEIRKPLVGPEPLDVRSDGRDDRSDYAISRLDAIRIAEELDSSCLLAGTNGRASSRPAPDIADPPSGGTEHPRLSRRR
jgi:hypothetical protein